MGIWTKERLECVTSFEAFSCYVLISYSDTALRSREPVYNARVPRKAPHTHTHTHTLLWDWATTWLSFHPKPTESGGWSMFTSSNSVVTYRWLEILLHLSLLRKVTMLMRVLWPLYAASLLAALHRPTPPEKKHRNLSRLWSSSSHLVADSSSIAPRSQRLTRRLECLFRTAGSTCCAQRFAVYTFVCSCMRHAKSWCSFRLSLADGAKLAGSNEVLTCWCLVLAFPRTVWFRNSLCTDAEGRLVLMKVSPQAMHAGLGKIQRPLLLFSFSHTPHHSNPALSWTAMVAQHCTDRMGPLKFPLLASWNRKSMVGRAVQRTDAQHHEIQRQA